MAERETTMTNVEKESMYRVWSNHMDLRKIFEKHKEFDLARDYNNQVFGENSLLLALGIWDEFIDRYFQERNSE